MTVVQTTADNVQQSEQRLGPTDRHTRLLLTPIIIAPNLDSNNFDYFSCTNHCCEYLLRVLYCRS
jgi:hypothetical protein